MATLFDGTRIYSAADGANALAVDFNDWQDKCIVAFEARYYSSDISAQHAAIAHEGAVYFDNAVGYITSSVNSGISIVPVTFPTGAIITDVKCVISAAAGATNTGSVAFVTVTEGAGPITTVIDNLFPNAGAPYGNAVTTVADPAAADYVITDSSLCYWRVTFPDNAGANDCRCWALYCKVQFGA